ncbi:MAG: AsmA family protein, partial [Phycisphaerae bacterium]|nr:AsmA family protein [Phycisphaerae bacterium]NIX28655.1 AsmA family protein [Phycisphaerae bacterium]
MRLKWIAGTGVILIIALMVTVYVFLAIYDYNKLKPRIARMVKDATGRELNLDGEVDLAIGFSPALVVTNVTFANAPWGSQSQMIRIETLQAQVRLLSLLHREVEVKNISLAGVDVLLETDSTGKGNWDFIAGDIKGKSAETFKPTEIDIDKIHIENLRFIFHKAKTGSKRQYTLNRLDVARSESEDELTLGLKADYGSQPITLSGKIGLIRNLFARQRFPLNLSGTFSNTTVKVD